MNLADAVSIYENNVAAGRRHIRGVCRVERILKDVWMQRLENTAAGYLHPELDVVLPDKTLFAPIIHEHRYAARFTDAVSPGTVVADIGAYNGVYSLIAAKQGADTYTFDLHPPHCDAIARHARINNVDDQVAVVNVAVSNTNGETGVVHGGRSVTNRIASPDDSVDATASAATLDSFVDSGERQPPDVIKLDVEGNAVDVLSGAETVLTEHHPAVFAELHQDTREPDTVPTILDRYGYTVETVQQKNGHSMVVAE